MTRAVLALLAVLAAASAGIASSGADFTAHSSSSASMTAAADFNTVAVTLGSVGTPLTGSVALSATASSNRGIADVKFQYAPSGTTDWVDVCTDATSSYGCTWNTTSIADGTYDVRALATDAAGYWRASVATGRVVDNYSLSVTLDDPGAMGGSEPLSATATGVQAGITYLKIQHRVPGASSWIDVCSVATPSASCSLDTTALPEGDRELRAIARDGAGHVAQTTPITRQVDNTPPETTSSVPPQGSGQVTISAEASDSGSGIQSVAFQVRYMGQWQTMCTDTSAPYECTADSSQVPDGTYDVRTITTDNAGVTTTGATRQIVVDNTAPTASPVATGNGGSTQSRLEQNDWIRFTWSEPMAPASILAGWTGAGQAITVHVRNNASNDEMHFSGPATVNLVLSSTDLKLGGNYVGADAQFNATMTMSGNSVTVRLDTLISSSTVLETAAGNANISWRPSSSARDLAGNATATTVRTENDGDRDF